MTTLPHQRFAVLAGGIFGLTGVALGALGAHRLEAVLAERGMTHAWETASRYHLFHAIALLAVAALTNAAATRPDALRWAARLWSLGIVLFSGSLYWFALGGPHPLVFVTPLGGIALIAGWACVVVAAWKRSA